MDIRKSTGAGDERLRTEILRATPKPSAQHDETILNAARLVAAKGRSSERRMNRWLPAGVGLAASLLLAVSLWQLAPIESESEGHRRTATEDSDAWPSGNRVLSAEPQEFRWVSQPGAERYRITIYNNAAESLWQSAWLVEARADAPDVADVMFANGSRYFWVVEIDGATQKRTLGPYWFRLK